MPYYKGHKLEPMAFDYGPDDVADCSYYSCKECSLIFEKGAITNIDGKLMQQYVISPLNDVISDSDTKFIFNPSYLPACEEILMNKALK